MTLDRKLFVILLACLLPIPLGADVVPLTNSGQSSVSGGASACDPICLMIFYPGQNDLGAGFSSPTAGSATDYFQGRSATASAFTGSSATTTEHQILLDLNGGFSFSGNSTMQSAGVSLTNHYSLVFDLTSASFVHVTGGFMASTNNYTFNPVSGDLDGEIHLTGPGLHFDQAAGSTGINFGLDQPFDASFALPAGVYTLDAIADARGSLSYTLGSTSNYDVSFQADFTDIPEPAWISYGIGLSMALGIGFARRRC
jgi:hypothetical protein